MEKKQLNVLTCSTYSVKIFLAGDLQEAKRICKEYCNEVGLYVTITPTTYIYTGGCEEGVEVTLINYPKYFKPYGEITLTAYELASELREGLYQDSVLVTDKFGTKLFTTRKVDKE